MISKNTPQDTPQRKDVTDKAYPHKCFKTTFSAASSHTDRSSLSEEMHTGQSSHPKDIITELQELDIKLLSIIARRSRILARLPRTKNARQERELRTAWEANAATISSDPRLIRQLFTLLQDIKVVPANVERPLSFNLAPTRRPVDITIPAPPSDRIPRRIMVLVAASGCAYTLTDVVLNTPVIECLKMLNQVGAKLHWEEGGRILCQETAPVIGCTKPILDKVIHAGSDFFNACLLLFLMVARPAQLKIVGEGALKFANLAPLRHFLPSLGARLTSLIPGQEGLPARIETSAMLPSTVIVPADLPVEAVEALILSIPGWGKETVLHLRNHPKGTAIAADIFPFITAAGLQAELRESESGTTMRILPGTIDPAKTLLSGINLPAAACLLAIPAFTGGAVCLSGPWHMPSQESRIQLLRMLSEAGLNVSTASDSVRVTAEPKATEKAAPSGKQPTNLRSLSPDFLPLGLVLALIPVVHNRGGSMPNLPADIDMSLVDSFLGQMGLLRTGATLIPIEPNVIPWSSPTLSWALALSLAAFLRPNIKLSNPGIVLNSLPFYWNIYNTLPYPKYTRPSAKSQQTPSSPARPVRRRVFVNHTPESEMPDEVIYPDED